MADFGAKRRKVAAAVVVVEVWGAEVHIEALTTTTVADFMSAICALWLDSERGDDGGFGAHTWWFSPDGGGDDEDDDDDDDEDEDAAPTTGRLRRGARCVGPYDTGFGNDRLASSTTLSDVGCDVVGARLVMLYDQGNSTTAKLIVRSSRPLAPSDAAAHWPHLFSHIPAAVIPLYVPPLGTPRLDVLFPMLARLLFRGGLDAGDPETSSQGYEFRVDIKIICLFQSARDTLGFAQASRTAMGDVLSAPCDSTLSENPFSAVEAYLVALDHASANDRILPLVSERTKCDAITRVVTPAQAMSPGAERQFQAAKEMFESLPGPGTPFGELTQAQQYASSGPLSVFFRLRKSEEASRLLEIRKTLDFKTAFPKCSRAFTRPSRRWISYRNGVLRVCAQSSRGVDRECRLGCELGKRAGGLHSLHDLFCAAEALWPDEDDSDLDESSDEADEDDSDHDSEEETDFDSDQLEDEGA
ncbi:hypothetical protein M885DRAFT_539935 [Pelagophyceae sp. CCMP2097]|nr:hypothetical protein M885DRAFT_539935 [Pelagophyceae sp. CCMP2097]|mmetsp:Transcript_23261/g.78582  ORF Transcript_23261/g.78582 Transcript_23261/m.78582 type:complete len:472 (-) Transcript_23261:61-1476(-)